MIYLFLSIVCSAYLVLTFKVFERLKINISQGIVWNYLACSLTGIIASGSVPTVQSYSQYPWFFFAVFLGCSFIFIFNLMGIITVTQGASVTTVANKLSMVIPVTLSFYLYGDKITAIKITGILLSLVAVVFTSLKEDKQRKLHISSLFLPIVVFLFSGLHDTLIKYSQQNHIQNNYEINYYNVTIFVVAFIAGSIVMWYNIITRKTIFDYKAIIGGFILGVPNYVSMYALVKILQEPGWDSSSIFPINNIGIVSVTTIVAYLVFKEHLSKKNLLGLALALLSIILVSIS